MRFSAFVACTMMVVGCPSGDDEGTPGDTTGSGTSTGPTGSESTAPASSSSEGPADSSSSDGSSSGSSTAADSTTGSEVSPCELALTEGQCSAASADGVTCGWFETQFWMLEGAICTALGKGGVCLTVDQADTGCGVEPFMSCPEDDPMVYARQTGVEGEWEALVLTADQICVEPSVDSKFKLCDLNGGPIVILGCRCGCMLGDPA